MIDGGGNAAAYGEWRRIVSEVTGGATYCFTSHYRSDRVAFPLHQVTARLQWLTAQKRDEDLPTYALPIDRQGEWVRCERVVRAPVDACGAVIRLGLRWSEQGAVRWDAISLERREMPPRMATLGTIAHRPQGTSSPRASVAEFVNVATRHAPEGLDVLCLPEGITVVGTGRGYVDVAEPIPGPTTSMLGELAAKLRCYVAAGVYEQAGSRHYNTAVLVDRHGDLLGTYRKVHLPQPEADGGLTPGDSHPVFDTDIGRVGMMICWDVQFPESARALAARGAEVILLPIWGGNEVLARARAIENHIYLVSASYDMRSFIVDPLGRVLAEAGAGRPFATAAVDLAQPYVEPWVGDMKTATWAERRGDLHP